GEGPRGAARTGRHAGRGEAGLGCPPAPSAVHWFSSATGAKLAVQHLDDGAVCATLPAPAPGYAVVDFETGRPGQGPARVHLYNGTRILGLQRPEAASEARPATGSTALPLTAATGSGGPR